MRNTPNLRAERYRLTQHSSASDGNNGAFLIGPLKIIASDGGGWDHVSVSTNHRCPTWQEMAAVKELFFRDDEAVFQFHPPKQLHVNYHEFCLHLWRPQSIAIALPPRWMIGIPEGGFTVEEEAEIVAAMEAIK